MQIAGNKVASPWGGFRPLILYPQVEETTGQGQAPPHIRLSSLTHTVATEPAGRSASLLDLSVDYVHFDGRLAS